MNAAALQSVRIFADDLARATSCFEAIVGTRAEKSGDEARIRVGDASVLLTSLPPLSPTDATQAPRPSMWGLDIGVTDPRRRLAFVEEAGQVVHRLPDGACVDIKGVRVFIRAMAATPPAASAQVKLDHVAMMVVNLDEATLLWERLTGLTAHRMAVHPVSKGTLAAARFALGPRMIELLAPLPGMQSALATRLTRVGEGPFAMALPAVNLDEKLSRLRAAGIEPLYSASHWIVRPSDASGVPIQLTPRVEH